MSIFWGFHRPKFDFVLLHLQLQCLPSYWNDIEQDNTWPSKDHLYLSAFICMYLSQLIFVHHYCAYIFIFYIHRETYFSKWSTTNSLVYTMMANSDPDISLVFFTSNPPGIPQSNIKVDMSEEYNRKILPDHEKRIDTIWASRQV